jgi:hypothetical protein
MDHDLHITRKDDWSDRKGPRISLAEWFALVRSDPEMRLDAYEPENLSVWTEYGRGDETGHKAWFVYSNGEISVKNPNEDIIRKMRAIARALSAKVQGDDGEVYGSSASEPDPEIYLRKKPWWRFW